MLLLSGLKVRDALFVKLLKFFLRLLVCDDLISNNILCRDIMVSDTLPAVSNTHDQLLGDGLQDGLLDRGVRGMPIQRTNSSSSFGSEGAPFAASGGGMNGYHHGYQGLSCSQVPYCFERSTLEVLSLS